MEAHDLLADAQAGLLLQTGRDSEKPRKSGITMVLEFDVANYGPAFLAPYSQLVDKVKILDTLFHDDFGTLIEAIARYNDLGITVACGGTQFELALAQGTMSEYVQLLKTLGINEIEVEHHADEVTTEQLHREVRQFKDEGFTVIGEVGKKWAWKDPTRVSRDEISVAATVDAFGAFADAGADWIYWEGAVVGGLIGRQLENSAGQQQLLEVARQVDTSKVLFEVYDRRNQPLYPMIAWLVQHFGPNVNLANIDPWTVKRVEWIRNGIIFEMDHPYLRWKADPSVSANWWNMPDMPDYAIDVQRPYALD